MKGALQMDYIIAAGLFILVLALVTQYILSYYSTIGEYSEILSQNGDIQNLMNIDKWYFVPNTWPETSADASIVFLAHLNNESSENGTLFRDFSGYGNNGTCSGTTCPIYNLSGRFNSAYTFDGAGDYLNFSAGSAMNITNNITVTAWVYMNSVKNWSRIISKGIWGSGIDWVLLMNNYSQIYFALNISGAIRNGPFNYINTGSWYYVAGRYNGSKISTFVDGVQNGTGTSRTGDIASHAADLYVGGLTTYFDGSIDEVVIYNRSLSDEEIMNNYNHGSLLRRMGLKTNAYRFFILVNNTKQFYYNQSLNVTYLTNELVSFNYTDLGYVHDIKSTKIYDLNGTSVLYQINDTMITFATNIDVNESQWFTIYFDDDSSFKDSSTIVTGSNYVNETLFPIERIDIVQYKKIAALDDTVYSIVKNATNTTNDFRIRIQDIGTASYVMTLGAIPPRSGDVVALQKYIVFQNATGDIRNGKLIVQVW